MIYSPSRNIKVIVCECVAAGVQLLTDILFLLHFLFSFVRLRMQPNCPSGEERGETVTDRRQRRGIARPAHAKHGRTGRPLSAPEAHAKGLVLTANGVADPKQEKGKSARRGWDQISARDGSLRSRLQARCTTARPRSCALLRRLPKRLRKLREKRERFCDPRYRRSEYGPYQCSGSRL